MQIYSSAYVRTEKEVGGRNNDTFKEEPLLKHTYNFPECLLDSYTDQAFAVCCKNFGCNITLSIGTVQIEQTARGDILRLKICIQVWNKVYCSIFLIQQISRWEHPIKTRDELLLHDVCELCTISVPRARRTTTVSCTRKSYSIDEGKGFGPKVSGPEGRLYLHKAALWAVMLVFGFQCNPVAKSTISYIRRRGCFFHVGRVEQRALCHGIGCASLNDLFQGALPKLGFLMVNALVIAVTISVFAFRGSPAVRPPKRVASLRSGGPRYMLFLQWCVFEGFVCLGDFPPGDGVGSFSRSAVNREAGAQTRMSSVVAAVCLVVAILCLQPVLYYLPLCGLAAIVIVAVMHLVDPAAAVRWDLSVSHREHCVLPRDAFSRLWARAVDCTGQRLSSHDFRPQQLSASVSEVACVMKMFSEVS